MYSPGWWLNAKNGALIKVDDHAKFVAYEPKKLGIPTERVEAVMDGGVYNPYDTDSNSKRGKLIVLAAKHGWVRVRTNGIQWSLQLSGTAKSGVTQFMKKLGDWPGENSPFQVSDFASGTQDTMPYGQVAQALKNGTFVDLGSGKTVGRDAAAETGDKEDKVKAQGIRTDVPDEVKRRTMRGRLGQAAGIPMPDVEESKKDKRSILEAVMALRPTSL